MDVEVVVGGGGSEETSSEVIAAMVPSTESLFGPNTDDTQTGRLGFITV